MRWYDLGGEVGDEGLRRFKKGLVGKRGAVVVTCGRIRSLDPDFRAASPPT